MYSPELLVLLETVSRIFQLLVDCWFRSSIILQIHVGFYGIKAIDICVIVHSLKAFVSVAKRNSNKDNTFSI